MTDPTKQTIDELYQPSIQDLEKNEYQGKERPVVYLDDVKAALSALMTDSRIAGMELAKSRVLRRTEIPKNVRNPTRDHIVILGEEIAGFIDQDIEEQRKEMENHNA